MPKIKSGPAKFYSLFVPQYDWFQDLLKVKAKELRADAETSKQEHSDRADKWKNASLSNYLIDLVIKDFRTRNLLTADEVKQYYAYSKTKPKIGSTRFEKSDRFENETKKEPESHATFSLYIPKREDHGWIREKLESKFIKDHCRVKSRSLYIWSLFVKENQSYLNKSQLKEWNEEINKTPRKGGEAA